MKSALLALLLAALATACVEPDVLHYGTRTVATRRCRPPQTEYAREVVKLDLLGLAAWQLQVDLAQMQQVEVQCGDFTSDCLDFHIADACGTQAGYYTLGTNVVRIDPGRANGLFAFVGVMNHELIHWYIYQGPHPERARMHICPCGVAGPECWPEGCGGNNLMNAELDGLGTGTEMRWSGNTEMVDVGAITQSEPTWKDREFVRWAVAAP